MATFEDTYRQHAQAVFRFAMKVGGGRDVAEDLVQEAFLALYRNFGSIDQARLPGWLLTVVRNRARDLWRHRAVEQQYVERYVEETVDHATPETTDMESQILDSDGLKPVHRACLMLRYTYGMTRAEIADKTGLNETQVRGHLQYALTLLRKAYAGRVA